MFTGTEPMPRTRKPARDDKAVKISRDLAVKAKVIAETRGVSVAEYLSDLLRPPVERDFPRAMKQLSESRPPAGE